MFLCFYSGENHLFLDLGSSSVQSNAFFFLHQCLLDNRDNQLSNVSKFPSSHKHYCYLICLRTTPQWKHGWRLIYTLWESHILLQLYHKEIQLWTQKSSLNAVLSFSYSTYSTFLNKKCSLLNYVLLRNPLMFFLWSYKRMKWGFQSWDILSVCRNWKKCSLLWSFKI